MSDTNKRNDGEWKYPNCAYKGQRIPNRPHEKLAEKIIQVVKDHAGITVFQHKDGSPDIYVVSQCKEEIRKLLEGGAIE